MADLLKDLENRMNGGFESLKKEFGGLRTGRASTALLDPVVVEAYGSTMPLNQMASVSAPEPRMLSVQVWDRSNVAAVDKAIRNSGLGLNPQTEGQSIRIPLPDLSSERRAELAKVAGKYAEHAKVAIRNIRRDGMDTLKKQLKDKVISEDIEKGQSEKVQKLTDNFIKQIDEAQAKKEKEIMQV